jgi:hypothetical protein
LYHLFRDRRTVRDLKFHFTKTTHSTVYHLQDEVLLPWYLHTTPSCSVNGWYTFQNTTAKVPLVINSLPGTAGSYTNTAVLPFSPAQTPVTADVGVRGARLHGRLHQPRQSTGHLPADPSGKIALIDRGACIVSLRIDRAVQAGALGVLIGLVAPGDPISFSYGGGSNFATALVITQDTSTLIKNTLAAPSTVNATISPANAIPPPFSTWSTLPSTAPTTGKDDRLRGAGSSLSAQTSSSATGQWELTVVFCQSVRSGQFA